MNRERTALSHLSEPEHLLGQGVHSRHSNLGLVNPGKPRRGVSETELLKSYPQLGRDDIRAALAYAAETTREQITPASSSLSRSTSAPRYQPLPDSNCANALASCF